MDNNVTPEVQFIPGTTQPVTPEHQEMLASGDAFMQEAFDRGLYSDPKSGPVPGMTIDDLPVRTPGESLINVDPPVSASAWDPEVAQYAQALPELPESVQAAMSQGPSDVEMLNMRITDLERAMSLRHNEAMQRLEYLCNSMSWLTTMLSGVAKMAENMPGMGGMMKAMLKGGK